MPISDSKKTMAALLLTLLILPFVVNCFFAYPQTDDFVYSVAARDLGFFQGQHDWYIKWSGRFTSTALLSINPLVYDSLAGYRLFFAILITAQLGSLYLLIHALTKRTLAWQEKLVFSLALLFACLDQVDDLRSWLYWMAGVATYQVAATMMILWLSLVLLVEQDRKYDNQWNKGAVLALSLLLSGTNEIVLSLTFLLSLTWIAYQYVSKKTLAPFHIATFVAVATGSCIGVFAPGNFARMKSDYDTHRNIWAIAWNAFKASLASMEVWMTYPVTLILVTAVFCTVISRPQLRAIYGSIRILYSMGMLLLLVMVAFFIPYWATGMNPQNRVLNIIYFFFMIGLMVNVAVISSKLGDPALAFLKNIPSKRYGFVVVAFLAVLFCLQRSNFVTVTKDLLSGDSLRYSREMQQKQSQVIHCAASHWTTDDVTTRPASLYFYFISSDSKDWVNSAYAAYFGKKSVSLVKKRL
ncbi:DUF6056 family protein [Geomonas propionica]|uniref:Transmembrane protein n=1 Tax=Geomonas propionica TaxID=2798582 RepID=A0ABS0YML7_9BACT|nr:DUF6056 family protein [Geomonas propionica]MBJ6799230.1 hypothetical protein [Geomonas propionica]